MPRTHSILPRTESLFKGFNRFTSTVAAKLTRQGSTSGLQRERTEAAASVLPATPLRAEDSVFQTVVNTLVHIIRLYSDLHQNGWNRCLNLGEALRILEQFAKLGEAEQSSKQYAQKSQKYASNAEDDAMRKQLFDHIHWVVGEFESGKEAPVAPFYGVLWDVYRDMAVSFLTTDDDASGLISYDELKNSFDMLVITEEELEKKFSDFDEDDNGQLDFKEFMEFYKSLSSVRYVEEIVFRKYGGDGQTGNMTEAGFRRFLQQMQHDPRGDPGNEHSREFFADLAAKDFGSFPGDEFPTEREFTVAERGFTMTERQFTNYVMSVHTRMASPRSKKKWAFRDVRNECLDPLKVNRVYQDMKQPMTDYFIASSHNTYLMDHQLWGTSSSSAYEDALRLACRCVELDCWDGNAGKPIVTHGRTACKAVTFESCIISIAQFAFTASPYPVILSLEVHNSPEQQKELGLIMKEHFKPKSKPGLKGLMPPIAGLVHDRADADFCPEELKGYILVKGKAPSPESGEAEWANHLRLVETLYQEIGRTMPPIDSRGCYDEADAADECFDDEEPEEAGGTMRSLRTPDVEESGAAQDKQTMEKLLQEQGEALGRSTKAGASLRASQRATHAQKVSPELSSTIWMKSVKYLLSALRRPFRSRIPLRFSFVPALPGTCCPAKA